MGLGFVAVSTPSTTATSATERSLDELIAEVTHLR